MDDHDHNHDNADVSVTGSPSFAGAAPSGRALSPAAERALAEAAARRAAEGRADAAPPEHGGRGGLDPVRYADWELDGRAVDF